MNITSYIGIVLKGMAMGVAEVIPGVSGGTIAFITGIYERLINMIKSFDIKLLHHLKSGEFKTAWNHIDGPFIAAMAGGMLGGVVVGVFGVDYLLQTYPEFLWAFFFGLILASVYVVYNMVQSRSWSLLLPLIIGIVVAVALVSINPRPGSSQMIYLFVCGMIAICALILPGISGSFILLILGMYTLVIPTLKGFLSSPSMDEFKIIAVFGAGCILGLLLFARVLSWTFKNYYDPTLALLCGFMIGSLKKIWPWRNPVQLINKDTGALIPFDESKSALLTNHDYKIIQEVNVLPQEYFLEPNTLMVCLSILFGFVSVLFLSKAGNKD